MELEDNQSLNSVPGGDQLESSEGETQNDGTNNSSTTSGAKDSGLTLEDIQTLTGRKYESLEKAKIGLQETYKYVGTKQTQGSTTEMYGYAAKEIFTLKHPDFAEKAEKVFAYAKATKQTPEQAFNDLFPQAREDSLKDTPVDSINRSSDNRITPDLRASGSSLDKMSIHELKQAGMDAQRRVGPNVNF